MTDSRFSVARTFLLLHAVSTTIAYSVWGVSHFLLPRTNVGPEGLLATQAVFVFSAFGAATGLAAMAGRSGKSESVVLGISTIAAAVLLCLAP